MTIKKRIFSLLLVFMWSVSSFSGSAKAQDECRVTLKVISKNQDHILSHGEPPPPTHTLILMPNDNIPSKQSCEAYSDVKEIRMGKIERHDEVFQNLAAGDVVEGSLNYYPPSPFGKMLYERFHHGFRLLKAKGVDFSKDYKYFRHIEVIKNPLDNN